jgi:hypothetical protein
MKIYSENRNKSENTTLKLWLPQTPPDLGKNPDRIGGKLKTGHLDYVKASQY